MCDDASSGGRQSAAPHQKWIYASFFTVHICCRDLCCTGCTHFIQAMHIACTAAQEAVGQSRVWMLCAVSSHATAASRELAEGGERARRHARAPDVCRSAEKKFNRRYVEAIDGMWTWCVRKIRYPQGPRAKSLKDLFTTADGVIIEVLRQRASAVCCVRASQVEVSAKQETSAPRRARSTHPSTEP